MFFSTDDLWYNVFIQEVVMYQLLVKTTKQNKRSYSGICGIPMTSEVTEAEDGMVAGLCNVKDFDIIIMDIMMPLLGWLFSL